MSSRYYNNQYFNAPPYTSPYRARNYSQKSPSKVKPRPGVIRDSSHIPGPYSPTLGRKKPIGHWKKKPKDDDEEKRTKRGEFNQEAIEAELNKYKKGVFYHDDKSKQSTNINGHTKTQTDRYSQYQLTRTEQAPPQVYEDLPRAVPPNYEERIKTTDHINDDSKSDDKKAKTRKDKNYIQDKLRKKGRVRKKRVDRGVVTVSSHHTGYPPPTRYGGAPPDYYYYDAPDYDMYGGVPPAPPYPYPYPYNGDYTYSNIGPYGGYPAYPRTDRGVIQDDGSWYPYPDMLHQQQGQPPLTTDPYATPKQSRRNNPKIDSANVDLTTPLNDDKKRMSPGRRVNKIQKQLEYYFSPQNMSNDEFLRDSMDKNGWVDVEIIVAFNRMKVLGATKDLVSEAAWHSTTIEIDSKNPDKIRMTKLWKQYVSDKNKRNKGKEKDKEKERKKKKYVSSKQREKELDEAELNPQTIEYIVKGIERKHEKRKKRREQREKQKEKEKTKEEKDDVKDKDKDEEKEKEKEKEKEREKEENKEMEQNKIEKEEDDDMVEVD